jgi:hypothetical protein
MRCRVAGKLSPGSYNFMAVLYFDKMNFDSIALVHFPGAFRNIVIASLIRNSRFAVGSSHHWIDSGLRYGPRVCFSVQFDTQSRATASFQSRHDSMGGKFWIGYKNCTLTLSVYGCSIAYISMRLLSPVTISLNHVIRRNNQH